MARTSDLHTVILALYDAAADGDKWPGFLDALAEEFDATGSQVLHIDADNRSMSFSVLRGFDAFIVDQYGNDGAVPMDEALSAYQRHFSELLDSDPRIAVAERFPGRPFSCRDLIDAEEFHASRMYKEINRPANCEFTLGVSIPEENGDMTGLAVFRPREGSAFSAADVEKFGTLIPHLKQAVSLHKKLAFLDLSKQVALEALDQISVGVFLVDGHLRIRHANRTADEIAAVGDGLYSRDGYLAAITSTEHRELGAAVADAVASVRDGRVSAGYALTVPRRSGEADYPLIVSALAGKGRRAQLGWSTEPLALIYVTIPGRPLETPAELLQRLFGLTPTEARVTELIVGGNTIESTAVKMGISRHTARQHLHAVFNKSGTHRQAELVKLVLSTPLGVGLARQRDDSEIAARVLSPPTP